MYTIAFLKVRDFQLSKRHISTIYLVEWTYFAEKVPYSTRHQVVGVDLLAMPAQAGVKIVIAIPAIQSVRLPTLTWHVLQNCFIFKT